MDIDILIIQLRFFYGDSVGGYIKQFFHLIGKYFRENP